MRLPGFVRRRLREALAEDRGTGDKTAALLVPPGARARAVIVARESGVFCGAPVLREIFRLADPRIRIRFTVFDGKAFFKNRRVVFLSGPARAILAAERTALNLLGRLCGIATLTAAFVRRVRLYGVEVFDTRKTTPLWRWLEKYAVRVGGGRNHRMGLADQVFVKENHRPFADLRKLARARGRFEIEVRNRRELDQALRLRPAAILFDNFKPAALRLAVRRARGANRRIALEASGGIRLDNAAAFARTGVDRISVGALTHSPRSLDFSLLVERLR